MSSINNKILEIDDSLSLIFTGFRDMAQQLEFSLKGSLADQLLIDAQDYPGLYKIDINTRGFSNFSDWFTWFEQAWTDAAYVRKFTPNPRTKRVLMHREKPLSEWIPVYLGKSKRVNKRLWEHVNLPIEKPTTALKLASRTNMNLNDFRFSTIKIEVVNYDLIMPQLESSLRDKHNPLLGRQ
jgi:hypothetical protein